MPFTNIFPTKFQVHYKVANVSYCKLANILLTKTHKMINSPNFYPTEILHYMVAYCTVKSFGV